MFIITYLNMSKQVKQSNYTDKRTGIIYSSVIHADDTEKRDVKMQPHLDAFISNAFLKAYFGKSS
jgi:hypothetical protein